MIKDFKGITLVSLIITIALMLIISSITISVSKERFAVNDFNKMINDIELLESKVSNYYLKYHGIPIVRDKTNNPIQYIYTDIIFNTNNNDNEIYYILDLAAMEGISLNYGEIGFKNVNSSDDVYIINEKSYQIYYVRGVELKGNIYHTILDNNVISDNIPPTKPEIKIISGQKNKEGIYTTEVKIEIIPGKDNNSGVEKTTYSYVFTDINNVSKTVTGEIQVSKIITLSESGEYNFVVASVDNNNNVSNIVETIKTNIQEQPTLKLSDMVTPSNYGDKIEYEANGVSDWKVFFNDGDNVFIITSKFMPYTRLPSNSNMIKNGEYKISWESIYGAPTVGFEYGHAPIITELTQNSKVLERAERFKLTWIQENIDKDWNSARAVKDLLNNDIWNVFAEGLNGAEAIGAPTLEMFAESWKQKGCEEIKYTCGENGYSIGDNGSWVNLANASNGLDISLYLPIQDGVSEDENCVAYWLAAVSSNDTHTLLVADGTNGGMFGDWYSAKYYGLRPIVCLPSNAVATNSNGVWKNLTVD